MKKIVLYSLIILAAFSLLACSEPEATVPEVLDEVISFEASEALKCIDGSAVALRTISVVSGKNSVSHDNVYWAKEYTVANDLRKRKMYYFAGPFFSTADEKVVFSSYYCDFFSSSSTLDTWGGFVLSSNVNKTDAETQVNQFEVYADAGAGGSKTFAVCYDLKAAQMDRYTPQIDFKEPRKPLSVSLANGTWTYNFFKGNAADSYVVKITGKLAGEETGMVECPLINGAVKVSDWQNFDLSTLGEVDQIVFAVVSSNPMAPVYFCVDHIVLKNNK